MVDLMMVIVLYICLAQTLNSIVGRAGAVRGGASVDRVTEGY